MMVFMCLVLMADRRAGEVREGAMMGIISRVVRRAAFEGPRAWA